MDALCVSVGWLLWYKHRAWVCWDGGFRIGGGVAGCMFGCTGYWISYAFSLSGVVTVVFLGRWGVGLNALVVLLLLNWF